MSRSYRRPYCAITGLRSAAHDKMVARRCWRRAQNHAIRSFRGDDWLDLIIPARHEASFNDPWSWGRDGKQSLHYPPRWSDLNYWFLHGLDDVEEEFERRKAWYARLKRK